MDTRNTVEFGWLNYSSFIGVLVVSILIGIYHGFIRRSKSLQEYLQGGRSLGMFPISASLIVSFVSSTTIMGYPAEVYMHGTQILANFIGYVLAAPVHAFIFLPIFYNLNLTSVLEYIEMRFNSSLRKFVSLLYAVAVIMKLSVFMYGVAMALHQVTRLNIHFTIFILASVCLFYTILGGLNAVVWADTVQGVMMIAAIVFFTAAGTIAEGGASAVWQAADRGERLEFFKMDPDPTLRQSFFTVAIGHFFVISGFGVAPAVVQRYIAIKTLRQAQWSVFIFCIGIELFNITCGLAGLIIYARYRNCDPVTAGIIENSDEIFPYYITDFGRTFNGLPGVVIAGLVCSVMSPMSTIINVVSGTLFKDFIEPYFPDINDKCGQYTVKVLGTVVGLIAVLLVLALDKLGSIIELGMTSGEVTYGAMLGIYFLGVFSPSVRSLDVFIGALSSIISLGWILIRSRMALMAGQIVYETKPLSVEGCPFNVTQSVGPMQGPNEGADVFPLYKLSMFYYCAFGCLVTVAVGVASSIVRRCLFGREAEPSVVDPKLLSPMVRWFGSQYVGVPQRETEVRGKFEDAEELQTFERKMDN